MVCGLKFGPIFWGSIVYKVIVLVVDRSIGIVNLVIQVFLLKYSIFNWNISAIFSALNLASSAFSP